MAYTAKLRVWRGDAGSGALQDYKVDVNEGEVVLDVLHRLQATQASDLALRWNCKAGKCGSCSMEINGMPRLGCMTRMSTFAQEDVLTITPICMISFRLSRSDSAEATKPPITTMKVGPATRKRMASGLRCNGSLASTINEPPIARS